MICVCNPNNPTGRIMSEAEMDAVVAAAERCGAWLLADEVYRGAERERDEETPSFFGRYDKVLAQGRMSKAYGLPGLRVGWTVGPARAVADMWRRHEYTTITDDDAVESPGTRRRCRRGATPDPGAHEAAVHGRLRPPR